MKLTKVQESKVSSIWNLDLEDKNKKYEVYLKEGYTSNGETTGTFKTQKETKEFINNAEYEEVDYSQMETDGNVYEGFYANKVYYTNYRTKIATAMNGKFENGFKEMRLDDLRDGIEGADLLLDTVLKALVNEKFALESGKTVNVHIQWTLSKDRMHYTTCKLIRVEVIQKTAKELLEKRSKSLECVLGCYSEGIEKLSDEALAKVVSYADEDYTDVIVESNGKTYVVEIATVNNEKDFILFTKEDYITRYGDEKFRK